MHADTKIAPAVPSRSRQDRLASCLATLRGWHHARRDMIRLSEMSDDTLRDIGVTRDEVRRLTRVPLRFFIG